MPKPLPSVLADALRLDQDARAELAAELLASLEGPADPDAEQAWDIEIERRIAAIEAGRIPLESWADLRRRIEKNILGR
jgi:putative addiction module component (TIGR02574 family)